MSKVAYRKLIVNKRNKQSIVYLPKSWMDEINENGPKVENVRLEMEGNKIILELLKE